MKWQLEHIGVPSISPENLAGWYVSKLGGKVKFKGPGENPAFFVEVAGTIIEIYQCGSSLEQTADNSLAGFRHLALRVLAIEPAMKELAQKGVVFHEPIKVAGGGGRVIFFQDPEGNLLHLVERPEGSIFL